MQQLQPLPQHFVFDRLLTILAPPPIIVPERNGPTVLKHHGAQEF